MSLIRSPDPVLLVIAVFSRHSKVFSWARARLEECFGAVELASPLYEFKQTDYYKPTMGKGLQKCFFAFHDLVDQASLAGIKIRTNQLELELQSKGTYAETRPVNLDPGVLSLGKFLLATTKDQAHRVYLQDGIFAEVTLRFQAGTFTPWPWTYADYQLPGTIAFLNQARDYYRRRLRETHPDKE